MFSVSLLWVSSQPGLPALHPKKDTWEVLLPGSTGSAQCSTHRSSWISEHLALLERLCQQPAEQHSLWQLESLFLFFQPLVTVSEVWQGDLTLSGYILRVLPCGSALYLPAQANTGLVLLQTFLLTSSRSWDHRDAHVTLVNKVFPACMNGQGIDFSGGLLVSKVNSSNQQ